MMTWLSRLSRLNMFSWKLLTSILLILSLMMNILLFTIISQELSPPVIEFILLSCLGFAGVLYFVVGLVLFFER